MPKHVVRLAICFALLVFPTGCGAAQSDETSTVSSSIPVVKATLIEQKSQHTYPITLYGRIRARQLSQLGFELVGRIETVSVTDGDRVCKNQELAKLDQSLIRAERKKWVAEKSVAAAILEKLKGGERVEVIASAQAEVNQRRTELRKLESERQRVTKLRNRNVVSEAEYETTVFAYQAAAEALERAVQQLRELEAGSRPEDIAAQQGRVQALEAQIERLDIQLEKATLRAPFDGVVSRRLVDEGTSVGVGEPVIKLLEDLKFEARFFIPLAYVGSIKTIQKITVRSTTVPVKSWRVIPQVDESMRTVEVVIGIDKPYQSLVFHGETCCLQFEFPMESEGVQLPVSALLPSVRGLWSCYRLEALPPEHHGEKAVYQVVKEDVGVLHTDGVSVVVQTDVEEGALIMAEGLHKVVPGMRVRLASQAP